MQLQQNISTFLKIERVLRCDPKRFGVFGGLLVIILVVWARIFFNGPATATASQLRRPVSTVNDSSRHPVRVAASNPVLDWLAQPKKAVQRNLFAVNMDFFGQAGDRTSPGDTEQQIPAENLRDASETLKLQSTMMGSTPLAIVNGNLVREGDIVDGFTVVKIQPQQMTVQKDGVTLEVRMQ